MTPTVWLNGSFTPEPSASVPLRDTGLLHAAGVFTTMRSYAGKVFRLPQHLTRLRSSCQSLSIPLPYPNEQLEHVATELLSRNNLQDARLRLTVTRGHAVENEFQPTVFLTATPLTPYPEEYYLKGLTAAVEDQQKLNPYDIQAGHKTLNYFSRLAALRTANQRGAGEALLFDVHNYLQSGSISNIFLVKDGTLLTPPTQSEITTRSATSAQGSSPDPHPIPYPRSSVLPGITRSLVLDLAKSHSIPTRPAALDIHALLSADEAFLTNSIMGLMPLCRIERKPLGQDKPGPLTLRLMSLYTQTIQSESTTP